MKALFKITVPALAVVLAGCTTSSQVQELIDASHRDQLETGQAHAASIDLLKKSSITALENGKANTDSIAILQKQVEKLLAQQEAIKNYAEASKVMSAANTVKVADLEAVVAELKEAIDKTVAELSEIDQLQETVMMQHYQAIADSAAAAIQTLKLDGSTATNDLPARFDDPFEIAAPAVK